MRREPLILTDDFINELAADWYFLCLHLNMLSESSASDVANELIEKGSKLKIILRAGQYTYLQPLNIYADRDTFFDIWLDADGDIQVSQLYSDAE